MTVPFGISELDAARNVRRYSPCPDGFLLPRQLKIIHLVGWYFPESLGGSEVYVAGLASRLRSLGNDVKIAAPLAGAVGSERYEHDGIEVFRYPIPVAATRNEAQGRVETRGSSMLREYLSEQRPDIVHFHTITTGLGLQEMEFAAALGARVVFTAHLPAFGYLCARGTLMRWGERVCDGPRPVKCSACMLQQRGLPKALAWAIGWLGSIPGATSLVTPGRIGTVLQMTSFIRFRLELQRRMLDTVDRFVVLNKRALDTVAAWRGRQDKLVLNYLGHSAKNVSRKPNSDSQPSRKPILVGYVGRLAEEKGIAELLSAIESLPRSLPIRFEFRGAVNNAGAVAIAERIRDLAATHPNVRLEPPVPPERVMDVIRSYDVLCVPSTFFENGPTVLSEAHAVGTPVIGTTTGAMPEVIESGISGMLVEPRDVRALADALVAAAENPSATIDVWRSNLPHARSMDEIGDDYDALYRDLLKAPPTPPQVL